MPRYAKRRTLKSIIRIWIIPVLALACIGGFFYEEHSFKRQHQTWTTVAAVAEDTRLHPIARYALEYGSKDLYTVDVLATYSFNDVPQKDWIPLSESPKTLDEAKSQAASLKGKQCLVRWDPSAPDQKIAELP
jgi:hypothetical protein